MAELVSCNCVLSADIAATDLLFKPPSQWTCRNGHTWRILVGSRRRISITKCSLLLRVATLLLSARAMLSSGSPTSTAFRAKDLFDGLGGMLRKSRKSREIISWTYACNIFVEIHTFHRDTVVGYIVNLSGNPPATSKKIPATHSHTLLMHPRVSTSRIHHISHLSSLGFLGVPSLLFSAILTDPT